VMVGGWVGGLVLDYGGYKGAGASGPESGGVELSRSPGMKMKPQRNGIPKRENLASRGRLGSRGASGGGSRGGDRSWAATNKAPGRPGTADPHLMWEVKASTSYSALRPTTAAPPRKTSPKLKRVYGSAGNNRQGRVKIKHHGRNVKAERGKKSIAAEKKVEKMSDIQMQVAASKYFNPVNMAGYY